MKRAKLRGMKRNAAVVLGNMGGAEDTGMLTRTHDDLAPLVREPVEWALARIFTCATADWKSVAQDRGRVQPLGRSSSRQRGSARSGANAGSAWSSGP